MPSQLVCRPERSLPVAVLKVTGVLDTTTSDALRQALCRSLSSQPQAVLVDVADLDVHDPSALDVLCDVVDRTSLWPAVPIVLCSAGPRTAEQIAGSTARDCVALADTCDEALQRSALGAGPLPMRARLRPVPESCRQARLLVTQACAAWHLTELTATATLIATELVANVVRHAHTTMEVTVGLRNDRIHLSVRDGCLDVPHPADPGLREAGGRGLQLVRELTDSWGVLPVRDGKVVWTILAAGAPA